MRQKKKHSHPNEALRAARLKNCWTLAVAAEMAQVSIEAYSRWEYGIQEPRLSSLQLLCDAFGRTPEELGYGHLVKKQDVVAAETTQPAQSAFVTLTPEQVAVLVPLLQGDKAVLHDEAKRETLRQLARVLGIAATTPAMLADLANPEQWQRLLQATLQPTTNQQTLDQLALVPRSGNGTSPLSLDDLLHYSDLVRTCWNLSSAQLPSVEQLLPVFLPAVSREALQPGDMQPLAAHIACQAEQLSSIVSLHHDDLLGMEAHRQRAVFFGQLSGDVNLHVTAIMRLATTYYYLKRARKAYETYQQALPHVQAVTPLVRARVYIGLAEAAARCGEVQQALTYRTKAHEAFPDHPNQDPSAFFADGGHFTLALWESMAYMELGQPENAAAVLQDVQQKPALLLPARVQAELINHQAQAEIAMGHMEESAVLVEEGVKQALKLGSQRRYSEAYDNYQAMRLLWHREQRVKSLDELFRRS